MSDLPALAGIGGTLDLNGRSYTWSPLTIGDEAAFEAELRHLLGERLNVLAQTVPQIKALDVSDDERSRLLDGALREHIRLQRCNASQLMREFYLPEMEACFIRAHLRKHHPELSVAECMAFISTHVTQRLIEMTLEQMDACRPKGSTSSSSGVDSASSHQTIATPE